MSSRLIRSGDPVAAEPIVWRHAGGAAIAGMHPRRTGGDRGGWPDASAADLERQLEQKAQGAYQQGYATGEAAAMQRATERLDPVLASFAGIIQELTGLRRRFRAEAEEDTVKLAIAIARRVLHRELATDPEAILGLVIAAFQKLSARETHRLRVSPADAAALQENRGRLELPPALEIVPDASLTSGSVIFETARGELDASVDTQLAEIQRGFADVIKRRSR
jgi:flagellar assembly protein FliH